MAGIGGKNISCNSDYDIISTREATDIDSSSSPDIKTSSPVGNNHDHRPKPSLRSVSHSAMSSGQSNNSCSRSKTWEGFGEIQNLSNKKAICKNNSVVFGCRDGVNRLESEEAESRALGNPTCYSDNEAMLAKKETRLCKRTSICSNCRTKREVRKPTVLDSNKRKMFNSVRTFAICLSMLQLVQVMGSGYSKSALTSIERRYRLSTFSVGILQSCFHIGNLSVILFVSYFGSKWNRPRAIAIGSMIMALSSLMSAMPQFVGSRYRVQESSDLVEPHPSISPSLYMKDIINIVINDTYRPLPLKSEDKTVKEHKLLGGQSPVNIFSLKKRKDKLCTVKQTLYQLDSKNNSKTEIATDQENFPVVFESKYSAQKTASLKESKNKIDDIKYYDEEQSQGKDEYWNDCSFYIFIAIGSVLKGMGHSPLHPLGMSFIDDFATPRNSAVYIGVVSALSLLGPACGFILGSLTTGTWVDYGWVDVSKIQIGPHHPLWVGAWWIGYLVTAGLLLMATIPFCLFPRNIPKEQEDDNETNDVKCFLCFRRCYTDQSAQIESNQSDSEEENCADVAEPISKDDQSNNCATLNCADAAESKYFCGCEISVQDANKNIRKDTYNIKMTGRTFFGATVEIKDNFDEQNTAQLISYLEKPKYGNDSIQTDVSYGEMKLSSPSRHSLTSHCLITNLKPCSPPVNTEKRTSIRKLSIKRRSGDPIRTLHSRRSSKLEKLALFDFTESLKGLLTDVVFLSTTLAFVCLTSFLAASVTYVSKYMETQFSVTASFANLLNGSVNLPMAVVGNLLGGWLIRRFNLNVKRTMAVVVTGLAMTIICVTALLLFKCNQGTNVEHSIGIEGGNCASECNCGDVYAPVCDVTTNITYKSACHAGCVDVSTWRKTKVYTGCRCVVDSQKQNATDKNSKAQSWGSGGAILFRGPCHRPDCSKSHLPVFLGVMGTASLTAGIASTPSTLVILRIVPPAEKAFAIGIVFVFTRVLAWIPAPVYVGYVIDSACLRWSYLGGIPLRDEQERNHCEIYDKDKLRRNFFAVTGGLLVLSLIFYIIAMYLHSRRLTRKKRQQKDPSVLSFDSPLLEDEVTSSLRGDKTVTSQNEIVENSEIENPKFKYKQIEIFETDDCEMKSKNFDNDNVATKIVVSASAPVLSSHEHEEHLLKTQEAKQSNIIRATVV